MNKTHQKYVEMVQFTLYVLSLIAKIAAIFTTCHQMSLKM